MEPLKRLTKLNTKDCLWIYILRILASKPMHAYAIRSEIERRYGFSPGFMTAYKVLYLLKASGLVSISKVDRRQVYRMTKQGLRELKKASEFYSNLSRKLELKKH